MLTSTTLHILDNKSRKIQSGKMVPGKSAHFSSISKYIILFLLLYSHYICTTHFLKFLKPFLIFLKPPVSLTVYIFLVFFKTKSESYRTSFQGENWNYRYGRFSIFTPKVFFYEYKFRLVAENYFHFYYVVTNCEFL